MSTNATATTRSRPRRATGASLEEAQAQTDTAATPLSARGVVTAAGTPTAADDPTGPALAEAGVFDDPEEVPVHRALARVMRDVSHVGKSGRNEHDGYDFRGIDATVNALGPAMRRHGVLPMPVATASAYRDVTTSQGKPSREVTVTVTYRFIGPAGDHLDVEVPGESMDRGDKGTAKAMSVALRIALLQTFALPTTEPDQQSYSPEREHPATATGPSAADLDALRLHPDDADALAVALVGELLAAPSRDAAATLWNRVRYGQVRDHSVGAPLDGETRQVLGLDPSADLTLLQLAEAVGSYVAANGESVTAGVLRLSAPEDGPQ